jgi:hypothetical protein
MLLKGILTVFVSAIKGIEKSPDSGRARLLLSRSLQRLGRSLALPNYDTPVEQTGVGSIDKANQAAHSVAS